MNLRDLAASLWRRKFLLLPLLILVGCACLGLASAVSPTYESKASVLLVPPKGGAAEVVNPYLSLNGLSPAVEVLAGSLSDQETADEVEDLAPGTTYEAFADPQGSAPVLFITVDAANADQATAVLDHLVVRAQAELENVQSAASVEPTSLIGAVVVSQDEKPEVIQKKRIRAVAAAAVVLLAGGLALIGLIDGLLVRRSRRGMGAPPASSLGRGELVGSGGPGGAGELTAPNGAGQEVSGTPARLALSSGTQTDAPANQTAAPAKQAGTPRRPATASRNPAAKSGRKPKRR